MNNDHEPRSALGAIEKGYAKMRPKWCFTLERIGVACLVGLVTIGLFFFGNLLAFLWRLAHYEHLTHFGTHGLSVMWHLIPRWEALVMLVGGLALVLLLRRFTTVYRWSCVMVAGVIIGLVALFSLAINFIGLNEVIQKNTKANSWPFIGALYDSGTGWLEEKVVIGTVLEIEPDSLTMLSEDSKTIDVRITKETWLPSGRMFEPGDKVELIGFMVDGVLTASAIQWN